jgi:glycoprotein endo-alpha-1,2-mannosidase
VIGTVIDVIHSTPNMYFSLHMEPYPGRSVDTVRQDVESLTARFGHLSSWHRIQERRVFYLYDSYHIAASEWRTLLVHKEEGITGTTGTTLRGTKLDGFFIGLWLNQDGGALAKASGMDGVYTYFSSNGFVYGSKRNGGSCIGGVVFCCWCRLMLLTMSFFFKHFFCVFL